MQRRDFMKAAAAGSALLVPGSAWARKRAPEYMPIVKDRMEKGYLPYYEEREITETVLLCLPDGTLNPDARGWARTPLFTANLSGHPLRKKKWNFWNWICPDFVFSITVADIDYAAFCAPTFTNFRTGENFSAMSIKKSGFTEMPEQVEKSITWQDKKIDFVMDNDGGDIMVNFSCQDLGGAPAEACFIIHKPKGHETLNFVAPWSNERFQMNSKHNTLPVEGYVTVRGQRYCMDPEVCHGVQDFGRGMWPYISYWNWGVATGHAGPDLLGINVGARWTTGTGANENGICLNGKLHKIMEDLTWDYDPNDWMKPWRVRSTHTDVIDMTLEPTIANNTSLNAGLLATGGTCSFGKWKGVVRVDGREIAFSDIIGWAEEFKHRW